VRVVVLNHVTLDGVMQGPGRPDEDTRDGFAHGGWAAEAGDDPAIGAAFGERMGVPGTELLLGRTTYEGILGSWNRQGGPFKDALNTMRKHVASRDPHVVLPWPNSERLHGDAPVAVAELRRRDGGNLVIMGSGRLIASLLPHGLIDELLLVIHPVVLGEGRRLFAHDRHRLPLRLAESAATATGAVVASYVAR
jgi:dihydrofolate reductase